MTSLHKKQQGFTIIELLIVIVVIGILAALVITTFAGIQQRGRDTSRQNDIRILHQHAEAYYAEEGHYPTLDQFNARGGVDGLDADTLQDPNGSVNLQGEAGDNQYAYIPDPANCDNEEIFCDSYELIATLEGEIDGEGTYTRESLN